MKIPTRPTRSWTDDGFCDRRIRHRRHDWPDFLGRVQRCKGWRGAP